MDASLFHVPDEIISFELFPDNIQLEEIENMSESENKLPEDICDLLEAVGSADQHKKEMEMKDFEEQKNKNRFQVVSEQDLDELQDENNAQSTHWQTNWAVRVMRGMF